MKFTDRAKSDSKGSGPTLYLRLKDGESINIIPRGEVYEFHSIFGKGEVPAGTQGAKTRYKMNVIVNEEGILKAKILEFGPMVYDLLATFNKLTDVTKIKFKFSRTGSTKDNTEYF